INLDVDRRMRHVRTDDRVGRPTHIMTAGNTQPAAPGQLAFAVTPAGAVNDLVDALRQTVALHAQAVHRDAGRLEQIAAADFGGIKAELLRKLVQLRLESEADIHRSVTAHGATDGLVGQHTIAVVLNVRNVVERAQQRPGVKDRDNSVGAVGATILYHARLHCGDVAVFIRARLEVNDGARTSAMRPEDFFARVSNFYRSFGFASGYRGDDLERDNFAFSTEAAANQRFDDANLRHWHF